MIKLLTKIAWRVSLKQNWDSLFYPSLVKKIVKSEFLYEQIFDLKIVPLTADFFNHNFLPLYERCISSRSDYRGDLVNLQMDMNDKLSNTHPYEVAYYKNKSTNEITGATIFSVKSDLIRIAYRAFDRNLTRIAKTATSLDFVNEKKLYQYFQTKQVSAYSHGQDTHPYINSVGLPLFKLKTGAKPVIPNNIPQSLSFDTAAIQQQQTKNNIVYFTNPDTKNCLQSCTVVNSQNVIPDILKELKSVLEFHTIRLTVEN